MMAHYILIITLIYLSYLESKSLERTNVSLFVSNKCCFSSSPTIENNYKQTWCNNQMKKCYEKMHYLSVLYQRDDLFDCRYDEIGGKMLSNDICGTWCLLASE